MAEFNDLTHMKHLNEEIILDCLGQRFAADRIYTRTGPLLLAVNPFRSVSGLYDDRVASFYRQGGKGTPHIFEVAQHAYASLVESGLSGNVVDQSILISGESGAGKTETTKQVMSYLSSGRHDYERQILESNPLLEAFGNAQTLRNNNSSRFGKFIQLQFSGPSLVGAKIETYLLEKVRVCFQSPGETNFHIFYQCCAAAAAIGGVTYFYPQFLHVDDSYALKLNGFADAAMFNYAGRGASEEELLVKFEETIQAMRVIGMDWPEIEMILSCVAGVLHVGNIGFVPKAAGEACSVSDKGALYMACALLGIDEPGLLEAALTSRSIQAANDESVRSPLSCTKAVEARDSFARFVYSAVFNYLVRRTNLTGASAANGSIGLLDVFGFEYFAANSFEQLCINYANERLHFLFTERVLRAEQELYESEGLPWRRTDFRDNRNILALLTSVNSGLFPMLDEECRVVGGSDQNFLARVHKVQKDNVSYGVVKTSITELFVVKHFAGPVVYTVASFVDKNKDALSLDVLTAAASSEILAGIIHKDENGGSTVSGGFRAQLNGLVNCLESTQLWFIRCIKPNHRNLPHQFEPDIVGDQLRYGGVLEAVSIARSGFPVRMSLSEFHRQFAINQIINSSLHAACARLCATLGLKEAAVGKTLVFLKQAEYEKLNATRELRRERAATVIQALARGAKVRRRMRAHHAAATKIQANFIGYKVREYYEYVRCAIVKIQIAWRKSNRNKWSPSSRLQQQMALLGAELLAAKRSMKTVEAFTVPPAPFGIGRRYASVSSMGGRRFSGVENQAPVIRSGLQKRVMDEMTRMRELIDRMSDDN